MGIVRDPDLAAAVVAFPPSAVTPAREMARLLRIARGAEETDAQGAAELALRVLDRAGSALRRGDCPRCLKDSCAGDCGSDRTDGCSPEPNGAGFLSADEVISEPSGDSIVEGMARAGSIVVLVGEAGSSKTFIKLSLSAAINDGPDWFGRSVKRGSVAYISFEGDALRCASKR